MAYFLQQILVEVVVGELSLIGAAETGLQSEGICDAKFFPDGHSCSWLFCFLHCKGAISEIENLAVFVHETGEDSFF